MLESIALGLLWFVAIILIASGVICRLAGAEYRRVSGDAGVTYRPCYITAAMGLGLVALLLAGCAPSTAVRERVHEVSIPVAVYAVDPAKIPAMPAPLGPRPASPSAAADTLLAKWCEAVEFILVANPLMQAGAGIPISAGAVYPECERKR